MKIYLINRPCDDSDYPGHSTGIGFTTREAAQEYCDKQNSDDPEDEDEYGFYVSEVEVS